MVTIIIPSLLLWLFFLLGDVVLDGVNGQSNGWLTAHATAYGSTENPTTLGGACGYDNTFHAGFGVNTAALSGALFRRGEACGACFQVMCNVWLDPKWCLRRAIVTITATNFCPSNNNGGWCDLPQQHFDMSMPAFFSIARQGNEGIVPVLYRRWKWRVKAAWVKGSHTRTWVPMQRNWGVNWQSSMDLRNQILSFKLTLVDGKTLEFYNVAPSTWKFGQTFSSQHQFS